MVVASFKNTVLTKLTILTSIDPHIDSNRKKAHGVSVQQTSEVIHKPPFDFFKYLIDDE